MLVGVDGAILESSAYPAVVQNHAQLTYKAVAAWLEGKQDSSKDGSPRAADLPAARASDITARILEKIIRHDELADQLRLQNEVAERLRERRNLAGALSLETTELQPILSGEGHVIDLDVRRPNRASLLIEDLMVAVNQVTASLLEGKNVPSIRRVVKDPERWDRIVTLQAHLAAISLRNPMQRAWKIS
jgi:exoribonuclease-2